MVEYKSFVEILVEKQQKILVIKFNKPQKKNCVNQNAYKEIGRALRQVANDEDITIVVLTGMGDYFTAGNDLSQSDIIGNVDSYVKSAKMVLQEMIGALIDCPKLLIALVNGPAIGIGATMASLCDLVWCAETAYFYTPFTRLGLLPEGCSSYLWPQILGRSKATETLLLSEKLTAAEAYHFNLVSKVFKFSEIDTVIWPKIREYSQLPPRSLSISKQTIRQHERDTLHKVLKLECEELYKRFYDEEFLNAVMEFSMRKQKNKSKL